MTSKDKHRTAFDPLHFLAGEFAGMIAMFVSFPMDTIKTRMQSGTTRSQITTSSFGVGKHILSREGFRGLYRGMSAPLIGYGFVSSIWFGVNFHVKSVLTNGDENRALSFAEGMLAGGIAGFAGCAILCPMERLKIYTQLNPTEKGGISSFRNLVRAKGMNAIYRGLGTTAVREVWQVSLHFGAYHHINKALAERGICSTKTWWLPLFSGSAAGCFCWLLSMPIDAVKTQLQSGTSGTVQRALLSIYRDRGVAGLWRGTGAAFMRCIPLHATLFFSYERIYEALCAAQDDDVFSSDNTIPIWLVSSA